MKKILAVFCVLMGLGSALKAQKVYVTTWKSDATHKAYIQNS